MYVRAHGLCKIALVKDNITQTDIILYVLLRIFAYLVATCTTLFGYIRVYLMSRTIPSEIRQAYNIKSKRLLLYPLAQILVSTPVVVNNIMATWSGYSYWALLITTGIWSLGGIINLIIYGGMLVQEERAPSTATKFSDQYLSISLSEGNSRMIKPRLTKLREETSIMNQKEASLVDASP